MFFQVTNKGCIFITGTRLKVVFTTMKTLSWVWATDSLTDIGLFTHISPLTSIQSLVFAQSQSLYLEVMEGTTFHQRTWEDLKVTEDLR